MHMPTVSRTYLFLAIISPLVAGQNLTGVSYVTPQEVAIVTGNASSSSSSFNSPFQIYHPSFSTILGSNPSLSLVYEADIPAFHEGGVVTSLDPLTVYSSSNQFNTTSPSPSTNNKTIVISRTSQNSETGSWSSEVIWNDGFPLVLANGGFQYRDGILWAAQGATNVSYSAALVYLPFPTTHQQEEPVAILNNYLGTPLNSPNDVYVSKNGIIYFTDPPIGFAQHIRSEPQLPAQVYAWEPVTGTVKVVADGFSAPNGIQLSPDEKTAYVTDTEAAVTSSQGLSATRTIYAFDIVYPELIHHHHSSSSDSTGRGRSAVIPQFTNRRTFAQPAKGLPDGVKCDTKGNVWVGCGDGIEVFSPVSGVLLGRILVDGGAANLALAEDGKVLALNEKRLWLVQVDASVEAAVGVGEKRG